MFAFLRDCYDPSVEDGFADKKTEAVVVVERRLAGTG